MINYAVKVSVCTKDEVQQKFYSPCKTLREANAKLDSLFTGNFNIGQKLYDPHTFAVFGSIFRIRDNKKIRTVQLN